MNGAVLRERIIWGGSLAATVLAVCGLDGWLSTRAWTWRVAGVDVGYWLRNGALLTAGTGLLVSLLVRELLHLARLHGFQPLRFESYLFVLGLVVGPYVSFNLRRTAAWYDESLAMLWLAIALGYAFWAQAVRRGTHQVLINLSTTMFIIFYAGGLAGYITRLRMEVGGTAGVVLVLYSMAVVKMTDVGAYFTGLWLGRTKLIPWLSPKKTWEGLFGGLVWAVLCALLVGWAVNRSGLVALPAGGLGTPWGLALFGLLMAVFSIAGDLAASLLKRDAALKDSSHMIPGLGGVLDVVDSPLLAAPAAWYFWTRLAPPTG